MQVPARTRSRLARFPAAVAAAALGASCYTGATPAPGATPSSGAPGAPAAEAAPFTITAGAVGPITASTPANLLALRALLPGFEVVPVHLVLAAATNRLAYTVYRGGERLLQVVPDEAGRVFHVQAVSPRVAVADRPWRSGGKLTGVRGLTTCKCWAEEVVLCFRTGEHVALAFARECAWDSYSTDDERQDLIGLPIQRVLWSPRPYTEDSSPYGGEEYGTDGE